MILLSWLSNFWDWFWYYRRGKIKYDVYNLGDTYHVMASNGKMTVCNNYGSTLKLAKEIALTRLIREMNKKEKEKVLVHKGLGYALYREKK